MAGEKNITKVPVVQMDGFGISEIESLAEVTKDMAGSYFWVCKFSCGIPI